MDLPPSGPLTLIWRILQDRICVPEVLGCQILDIVTQTREQTINTIMSNSFGFGGTNATLVMQRYKG